MVIACQRSAQLARTIIAGAGIVGYEDPSEAMNVTRGLLHRGYSAADFAKIWSGNFMRVLRAAEAAAR